jgi:hypothetical protein
MPLLVNILAFQIGWFACVLGAANSAPLLGPAIVAAVVALHLSRSNKPAREMTLVLAAGLLGASWDSSLVAAGWIQYPSGNVIVGLAPYWIVAMWMLLATTLNVSLRWLRGRIALAVVLGGLSGPLAFLAGAGLGGVTFLEPRSGLVALALGWAVILPLLSALSTRLDGMILASVAEQPHV